MGKTKSKHKDRSTAIIVSITILLSMVIIGFAAVATQQEKAQPRDSSLVVGEAPWQAGPDTARITLVVFSDFNCSHCRDFASVWPLLRERYPDDVRVIHRHFLLDGEASTSLLAMEANEAAGAQGKFWEYQDLLWANYGMYDQEHLLGYAEQLGLDLTVFTEALTTQQYRQNVLEDYQAGAALDIPGTPAIFINGLRYSGSRDLETLTTYIQQLLDDL
ncbi:MAG TPA: DsbA family protein [bacterium]|nr:DsbA family protein [bacterium]